MKFVTNEKLTIVTFAKLIGRHRLNAVLGGNLNSNKTLTQGYSAQGFPEGDFVYPSFSNGYPEGGSPTYYENTSRSMNGYFNLCRFTVRAHIKQ